MEDSRIIAIRKQDINLAHQAFVDLMDKTERFLNKDAKENSELYKKMNASDIEKQSEKAIIESCEDTPFHNSEVRLVSGQNFPDIIAEKYYGVEVKSTKSDHWTSTGSSIVESTRDVNVEDIYMLFGKMGGKVPEFRCRPYEDVLYDIAVTHSPRYLINMQLKKEETIFSKMGIAYDDFRKSDDSIDRVRRYYREKAKRTKKFEMPWWITQENVESAISLNIKLWNTLPLEDKKSLQAKCMILFPEALNPKKSKTKYNQTTLWLCSYNQVVMPNIRGLYSAGGKITHVNGKKLVTPVAQVFNQIVEFAPEIKRMLDFPTKELLLLIQDYNPALLESQEMYESWLQICEGFGNLDQVPIRKWIEEHPTFSFSK